MFGHCVCKKLGCAVPVITVGVSCSALASCLKKWVAKAGSVLLPQNNTRKIHTCVCSLPLKLMERRPFGALKLLWQQNLIKFCQHLQKLSLLPFPLRCGEGRVYVLRVFCCWWEWFVTLSLVGAWRHAAMATACNTRSKCPRNLANWGRGLFKVIKISRVLRSNHTQKRSNNDPIIACGIFSLNFLMKT